ncbi:MAG TPA: hypothetical protein VI759_08090 [Dehalococcoidia bacterium]|nr:hypothetical protein [Dehalococcoidia bacterium]
MNRVTVSITLAFLALLGTAGIASATPEQPDRNEVMTWAGGAVVVLMLVLLFFYCVKWYFGLEEELPPPDEGAPHH